MTGTGSESGVGLGEVVAVGLGNGVGAAVGSGIAVGEGADMTVGAETLVEVGEGVGSAETNSGAGSTEDDPQQPISTTAIKIDSNLAVRTRITNSYTSLIRS
ncbi:MAG: hypothetical protein HOE75_02475 [Chloroflexi bacterium]|nr:hypothetical protein [Chloroflexota bacterium]MBT4072531.1 hypothetical protein [Chloroflexota bacterium]MBT5318822.1 hypothetical protein [Chloroflexota bacterium]MBT6680616.1 hypothetical protein [Chloroflexota bacterium]